MKEATCGTIRNINQKQDIVKHTKKPKINKQKTKNLHLVGSEFEVKIDISMT